MERSAKLAGVLAAAVLSVGAAAGPALASVTSAQPGCVCAGAQAGCVPAQTAANHQASPPLVNVADDSLTTGMIANSGCG